MSPTPPGPFTHLHRLRSELNRLIEALLEQPSAAPGSWLPAVDLVERETAFEVQLELPGVSAGELQLELVDDQLLVRGAKPRLPGEPPGSRFYLMERYIGSFAVTVDLPHPVLPERATARLQHGVLTVTLPKLTERRHRRHLVAVEEP